MTSITEHMPFWQYGRCAQCGTPGWYDSSQSIGISDGGNAVAAPDFSRLVVLCRWHFGPALERAAWLCSRPDTAVT